MLETTGNRIDIIDSDRNTLLLPLTVSLWNIVVTFLAFLRLFMVGGWAKGTAFFFLFLEFRGAMVNVRLSALGSERKSAQEG